MAVETERTDKKKYEEYSLIAQLKREDRYNDNFGNQMSILSLEEVIGIKLELTLKATKGIFYGFPIWQSLPEITKEAMYRAAVSVSKTKKQAISLLGIDELRMRKMETKYKSPFIKRQDI